MASGRSLLVGVVCLSAAAQLLTACSFASRDAAPSGPSTKWHDSPQATAATSNASTPSDPTQAPSTPNRRKVTVQIATSGYAAGAVYATGVIPDVSEQPGTCTLTATGSGGTFTGVSEAHPAAASMDCGLTRVAVPGGSWSLVLSYLSSNSEGASAATPITVP